MKPIELWAFVENSDFQRYVEGKLTRWDEVALTSHDTLLHTDYQLLAENGFVGVRDAAIWYKSHPQPDAFDWTWLDRVVQAADKYGLKLYLDLWHYGYPDWLDIMAEDAPQHFANFARAIAQRYPQLEYYCICNEPTLLIENGGQKGIWGPFRTDDSPEFFRQQICRMIIAASKAVLEVKPDAILVLPEPWHAPNHLSEDDQAAVIDTVLGLRDPQLGGSDELVSIVGLNHYRDTTLPPFHRLILRARERWPQKELWISETSGPPTGWQQSEWFWWMLAETRLANLENAGVTVFTWAPIFSMYDWEDDALHLKNGVWYDESPDQMRQPNGTIVEAIQLARNYGYLA